MESGTKTNVLLVFANPLSTSRLQLDTEEREIQQSIERSKYRDNIKLVTKHATTIKDLRRALLEKTFQVIHISGHGRRNGLILVNDRGGQYVVDPPTFVELFQRYPATPYRILCNGTQQKSPETRPVLSLEHSRNTSLHKIRYGILPGY